jgi:hypothetical protein
MTNRVSSQSAAGLILAQTADLRSQLLNHPIYDRIDDLESLRIFMQHHVFAVLDFMWLLKRLQKDLCCNSVPWLPVSKPSLARFVNEIVLGEETDEDGQGGFRSHFELYLQSMDDVGADRGPIESFVSALSGLTPISEADVSSALEQVNAPNTVRRFVNFTYCVASRGSSAEVACVFCFGREDIIPDMFQRLLHRFESSNLPVPRLEYYIRRHIELDGDHHGPLTRKMVELLCDTPEKTTVAIQTAQEAISRRIELWDGVLAAL